jgi:hypothetical protein
MNVRLAIFQSDHARHVGFGRRARRVAVSPKPRTNNNNAGKKSGSPVAALVCRRYIRHVTIPLESALPRAASCVSSRGDAYSRVSIGH